MKPRKLKVELLPSRAEIVRAPVERAALDQLVQQKVAEILATRDEFLFEPFFRSRQVSVELRGCRPFQSAASGACITRSTAA
jgi:hypothetical protein